MVLPPCCVEMHVAGYQRQLLVRLLPGATLEKDGSMKKGCHVGGRDFIRCVEGQSEERRVKTEAQQPANIRDRDFSKSREQTRTRQR